MNRKLVFRSYYKLPVAQTITENCVSHIPSLVPIPGRDIMVQAWYQGGASLIDFTDASNPKEIGYFDRGPINPTTMWLGGFWSTYYYNGAIYASEIRRGFDVFKLHADRGHLAGRAGLRREGRQDRAAELPRASSRSRGRRRSTAASAATCRRRCR